MSGRMPVVLVEEDRVLRLVQVILDPTTSPARMAAFADYNETDQPDFAGWLSTLRAFVPSLYPAQVRLVADAADFAAHLPEANVAIVESFAIGAEQLAIAGRLKVVHQFGRVSDHIDAGACRARGIPVYTLRRRTNISMAEHTLMLMLALARRLPLIDGLVSEKRLADAGYAHRPYDSRHTASANYGRIPDLRMLHGRTLGLLGFGEIAREVATLARVFGMRVLYHKRHRLLPAEEEAMGVAWCDFDGLFERSEFLSVHVPYSASTTALVDAAALARMPRGAYLVNTARAAIVEHDALVDALRSGRLAGAGFDVQYGEPADEDDPLLHLDNVILTPHLGGASRVNGLRDAETMLMNLESALSRSVV